jgi:adenylate cyclase class IV
MSLFKITPKTFSLQIEQIAVKKSISHLDAVTHYCETNEIEVETVAKLITKALKAKIEANARELRLISSDLEGRGKLPID